MKKIITYLVLIVVSMGIFVACNVSNSDDENDIFTDGIVNDVWDFISEDDLSTLENSLEVPIYRGKNPPNIEEIFGDSSDESSTFLMKPFVMVTSTVPTDQDREIPRSFSDLYINLSNQNTGNYTIEMALTHPNHQPFLGTSGFIVGENNRFTIFGPLVQQSSGHETRMIHVLSGQIGDNELTNLNLGILMVDNGGDESQIPNSTGRRFIDQEDTSVQSGWPHSSVIFVPDKVSEVNNKEDDASGSFSVLLP